MDTIDFDAKNITLGRAASQIAVLLRGKNKPSFLPNKLPNIEVYVVNLDKIKFTGRKLDDKKFYHYSGYHGGMKEKTLSELWAKRPASVLRMAVYRMLPKNKSRDKIIKNLKIK